MHRALCAHPLLRSSGTTPNRRTPTPGCSIGVPDRPTDRPRKRTRNRDAIRSFRRPALSPHPRAEMGLESIAIRAPFLASSRCAPWEIQRARTLRTWMAIGPDRARPAQARPVADAPTHICIYMALVEYLSIYRECAVLHGLSRDGKSTRPLPVLTYAHCSKQIHTSITRPPCGPLPVSRQSIQPSSSIPPALRTIRTLPASGAGTSTQNRRALRAGRKHCLYAHCSPTGYTLGGVGQAI